MPKPNKDQIDGKYAEAMFAGYKGSKDEFIKHLQDPKGQRFPSDLVKERFRLAKKSGFKGDMDTFIKTRPAK